MLFSRKREDSRILPLAKGWYALITCDLDLAAKLAKHPALRPLSQRKMSIHLKEGELGYGFKATHLEEIRILSGFMDG